MVVEPDILVRMVIAEYLRDCGYKVIEGHTADCVLTVLGAQRKLDIVLAEVRIAGTMDGFALSQWLHQNHPHIDVILTSSAGRAAEKAGEICNKGPEDRPYHPDELLRQIHLLRERRKSGPGASKGEPNMPTNLSQLRTA
jgi:DNA-binding NtrC family response regulator